MKLENNILNSGLRFGWSVPEAALLLSCLLIFPLLSSCGRDLPSEEPASKAAPDRRPLFSSIFGRWVSRCISDGVKSESASYDFYTNGAFIYKLVSYKNDRTCSVPTQTNQIEGNYLVGNPTPDVGTSDIDLHEQGNTITLLDSALVSDFNATSACGKSNWNLNEPFTITVGSCEAAKVATLRQPLFSIYKLKGYQLYLGTTVVETRNGTTNEKRHDTFASQENAYEWVNR